MAFLRLRELQVRDDDNQNLYARRFRQT